MTKTFFFLLLLSLFACNAFAQSESLPLKIASPDGKLEITLALNTQNAPVYSVTYNKQQVLVPSLLGLEFKQGGLLSRNLRATNVRRDKRDETYELVVGKTKKARDNYNELTVSFEEQEGAKRKVDLIFRAYDDGAAFRYRLPAQESLKDFEIAAERTEFRFPTDLTCYALRLGGFTTSYEGEYDKIVSNRIHQNLILGLPLVCKIRNETVTFALSEADLRDYAGMYFSGVNNGFGVSSRLSPRPDDKGVAVRGTVSSNGFQTPWRVVMTSSEAGKLIESTLITNLNPPSAIGDTSWIRAGRSAWDWWSGPANENTGFQIGMNDATMKYYIDFASEMGLEYMLIDAGWYSKEPFYGDGMDLKADITKPIPEINLPELISYAKNKNVGIFVWTHWRLINDQMDKAFPFYEKLGVKGVKIDFMDRDDQEMVEFYHRVLKKAAEHHLLIDFHGAYKPTGLIRTYPNYLTQEGVLGAEYNKWSARITATHNVTLAFTRLLLGPMDYTPGGFHNTTRQTFEIKFNAPRVMTTRGQQLAMFVVYDSPFACVSDSPGAYRGQAGAEFLKTVPTSWDETKVLGGDIGEYIVIARRRGTEWYLGAMTNEQVREIQVPLEFLGSGNYQMSLYADGAQPTDIVTTADKITNGKLKGKNSLTLKLAGGGGAAIRFSRIK